uniref:Angiogenic factor with G patch and FHA domains 1 isoform X1 n=1 Tax=Diabrotica virgifera virgifera TaxID=50390 RepID=A0A6P7F3Z1_DIAVI
MDIEVEQSETTKTSDSSCSESDIIQKCDTNLKKKLLEEFPEALEYIKKLESIIKRHVKKINKLRNKLKAKVRCKENSTQTDLEESYSATDNTEAIETAENTQKSLVDDIKEAAEIAMQKTGFVYEETSGLYYDYNTGYYYNAEYGLYYDGTTGKYLQYNSETQTYEYHSQVAVPSLDADRVENAIPKRKKKHKIKAKKILKIDNEDGQEVDNIEEGECSASDTNSDDEEVDSDSSDISKSWPPCMRIIVESTEIPGLKKGSLHIITCSGGSLGREGAHSILLKDPNASKHHLKITFDEKGGQYQAVDLGSRNGTLLNGKRMSPSKQESDAMDVVHGSKIQIGQTVLLCHVHDGNQTCGHCEPGLIQVAEPVPGRIYSYSKSNNHKKELKGLKMRYGVSEYEGDSKLASGYTDRAQKRRETVGSQNPHEKTQVASVDESINKENKGFKLLQKMGWKEGESLGKTGDGLIEPIKPTSNEGTAGIGAANTQVTSIPTETKKQSIWKKTNERFQKLPESSDAFDVDVDD